MRERSSVLSRVYRHRIIGRRASREAVPLVAHRAIGRGVAAIERSAPDGGHMRDGNGQTSWQDATVADEGTALPTMVEGRDSGSEDPWSGDEPDPDGEVWEAEFVDEPWEPATPPGPTNPDSVDDVEIVEVDAADLADGGAWAGPDMGPAVATDLTGSTDQLGADFLLSGPAGWVDPAGSAGSAGSDGSAGFAESVAAVGGSPDAVPVDVGLGAMPFEDVGSTNAVETENGPRPAGWFIRPRARRAAPPPAGWAAAGDPSRAAGAGTASSSFGATASTTGTAGARPPGSRPVRTAGPPAPVAPRRPLLAGVAAVRPGGPPAAPVRPAGRRRRFRLRLVVAGAVVLVLVLGGLAFVTVGR